METSNKDFEIYKKNQKDNDVVITPNRDKDGASKSNKTTTSYSAGCGSSSSGSCGPSSYYGGLSRC